MRLPVHALLRYLIVALVFGIAPASYGESLENDEYLIYYNAFNANFLPAKVTEQYQLNRSRYRGLVNICVQRKMPDGSLKKVVAKLSGYASRLSGSENSIDFQLISEGDSIYYLGQFIIGNKETLDFDIKIRPRPQDNPIKLSFRKTFYIDN